MTEKSISDNELIPFIEGINNAAIIKSLDRICGQIYKLLPMREENQDYIKPLETIYLEVLGLSCLIEPQQETILSLVSKLAGLKEGADDIDFSLYRRTIFECCGLVNKLKDKIWV